MAYNITFALTRVHGWSVLSVTSISEFLDLIWVPRTHYILSPRVTHSVSIITGSAV